MSPTVALRHPDDFFAIVYVVAIPAASVSETAAGRAITKKGFGFVGDDRAGLPGRADFYDAINLMAALVVFKREGAAVFSPYWIRKLVRIRKQRVVDVHLL